MLTTLHFNYGFEYKNVRYVWKHKKLFRLPYIKNKRNYTYKEIPIYCFKTTFVANVQKTKLTFKRMENLTKKVDWSIEIFQINKMPF